MTYSTAVAAEVRIELARLDLSQANLARRLGVSPVWLHRRMRGPVDFTVDEVHTICRELGLDASKVLAAAAARHEAAVSA